MNRTRRAAPGTGIIASVGVPEARLDQRGEGLVPVSNGWFVVNLAQAQWPGQAPGMYHAESAQEGFLVLSAECRLLVEGTERTLRQWDFFHCPPGTAHITVGAGDGARCG
jgi:glyoxylate utilization-related uncharacterized protein